MALRLLAGLAGFALIATVLWDAFETIVLPRRAGRRFRLTRYFYLLTWRPWSAVLRRWPNSDGRERSLSYYGPLSLLLLLAVWAIGLVVGFGLLQWALASTASGSDRLSLGTSLYFSGTTFFTLGLGDVVPHTAASRLVEVLEAGSGLSFLALVIGYLPILYQAFSQREQRIALLDARAGSPPSAVELLRRHGEDQDGPEALVQQLQDWEQWSAALLESHLSFPVVAYYRSQHDHVSWVATLTLILDLCSLVLVGIEGVPARAARHTFAIARHAAIDLSQVFASSPMLPAVDRLSDDDLAELRLMLMSAGVVLRSGEGADRRLAELRGAYEPYVSALSEYLLMDLPPWLPPPGAHDNWQTSVWRSDASQLL